MTIIAVFLLFISFILGLERLGSRDGPNVSSQNQIMNRGPEDPLSIPESHGEIYIGLKQKKENDQIPGTYKDEMISFDQRYINAKIEYQDNLMLRGRENLAACQNVDDFNRKVNYSSNLRQSDF